MSDEFPDEDSRAEAARRKAEEANQSYTDTLEEIKEHFGVLLELRDRRIGELERKLARLTARSKAEPGSEGQHYFKVLVVENSPALRTTLVAALQRKFHAFGAAHGRPALKCLAEKPDLLLIGLYLPHADCAALTRQIQRAAQELPIMVMCGLKTKELLESLQGLGVPAIFQKPFLPAEVVAGVEDFCKGEKCE